MPLQVLEEDAGAGGVLVLAAGQESASPYYLSSVYRSLDGGANWGAITSSGPMWPGRYRSALVYDLANTRLAIMGGETSGGDVNDFYTADVTPLFAVRFYPTLQRHLKLFSN